MNEKRPLRSFRAWEENQERLAFAEKLDLNVSEVINEVLKENLKPHLADEHSQKMALRVKI